MENERVLEELDKRISRCNLVISGLENNDAFKAVLDDFESQKNIIDNHWHLVSDKAKLDELRITKLAAVSILNVLENYKADLRKAQEEKVKLENPDKLVGRDYDNA